MCLEFLVYLQAEETKGIVPKGILKIARFLLITVLE